MGELFCLALVFCWSCRISVLLLLAAILGLYSVPRSSSVICYLLFVDETLG